MRKLAALVVLTALACGSLAATAAATQTQTLAAKVIPAKRGTAKQPRGVGLDVVLTTGTTDGTQPSPVTRAVVSFPKGMTFNGLSFPHCTIDRMKQRGRESCPKGSEVGFGDGGGDASGAFPGYAPAKNIKIKIHAYNGPPVGKRPSIIFYVTNDLADEQIIYIQGKLERASGRYGTKLVADVPALPTLTGKPNVALTTFHVTIRAAIRKRGKRVNYIDAPTTCRKRWPFTGVFSSEDNQILKASDSVRCT